MPNYHWIFIDNFWFFVPFFIAVYGKNINVPSIVGRIWGTVIAINHNDIPFQYFLLIIMLVYHQGKVVFIHSFYSGTWYSVLLFLYFLAATLISIFLILTLTFFPSITLVVVLSTPVISYFVSIISLEKVVVIVVSFSQN